MKKFEPEKELKKKVYEINEITFHKEFIETKTVLGIDIYRYSEYPQDIQEYIPVLFNSLYNLTIESCIINEAFIFQNYSLSSEVFKSHFISTGDGGFQIFDNPIQAIVFAAYFQMGMRRFNSHNLRSKLNSNLYKIIGRIELRYAITTEKIFSYDDNYYGPAIINNARILGKDNLNRLLADFTSVDWFDKNINTIENLLIIKKEDLIKTEYFKDYDATKKSLLFNNKEPIKAIDILKIGTIKSKNTVLEIYNLRIQIKLSVTKTDGYKDFVVTVGNLNTQGIE
jgi:hypothetical protein